MYAAGPFSYAFVTHESYIFEEVIAKHSEFCSLSIAMQKNVSHMYIENLFDVHMRLLTNKFSNVILNLQLNEPRCLAVRRQTLREGARVLKIARAEGAAELTA